MKEYIYDLETYPNFFLATFKDVETQKFYEFEVSDRKNESLSLISFLKQEMTLIGFNNVNFDYPILHKTFLNKKIAWQAKDIYQVVESVVAEKYSAIWPSETLIPQIDLFKIWHYDNKNKATSLKWLEFAMRWDNVY